MSSTAKTSKTSNRPCKFLNISTNKLLFQASLTLLVRTACVHCLPRCTFWTELWIVIHNLRSSKLASGYLGTCQMISIFLLPLSGCIGWFHSFFYTLLNYPWINIVFSIWNPMKIYSHSNFNLGQNVENIFWITLAVLLDLIANYHMSMHLE